MTIEDPVEYNLDGISQVQVNVKKGLSFAAGLRSFLRQDPDIICVQDLRLSEARLGASRYNPEGYFSYFWDAIDGTSNGVAIYTRKLPKAIMTGLGFADFDSGA